MPTTTPFHDEQNGAEIREKLNSMWADWLGALETAVGKDGWSPSLRVVVDGERNVIELYDWLGGTGKKPHQAGYFSAAGLTKNIADAADFRGFQGVKGEPGSDGADGEAGPPNNLAGVDVSTGASGTQASGFVSGVYPNQRIVLQIPRGDPGAIGPMPDFEVGTVMTGVPGSNVVVTITGTSAKPVLNFIIPQGTPGQDGSGTGDVVGPETVNDSNVMVQFRGTSGKLIQAMTLTGILKFLNGVPSVAVAAEDYAAPPVGVAGGTDFDTLVQAGDYFVASDAEAATMPNIPLPRGGALSVQRSVTDGVVQTYRASSLINAATIFQRVKGSTPGWGAWFSIYTSTNPQQNVAGNAGTAVIADRTKWGVNLTTPMIAGTGTTETGLIGMRVDGIYGGTALGYPINYGNRIQIKGHSNSATEIFLDWQNSLAPRFLIRSRGDVASHEWSAEKEVAFTTSNITGNASTATKLAAAFKINGVDVDGGSDVTIPTASAILKFAYAQRRHLRTAVGEYALVDLLGMFQFDADSKEPDDDESCFATDTGCWTLQCPSFDLVEAWNLPRQNIVDAGVMAAFSNSNKWPGSKIEGAAVCTLTSIAANSTAVFTGTVAGARPGDSVIATPPGLLGDTAATSSRLSFLAWVSADDVVSVAISNSSAIATTTNTVIRVGWRVIVLKGY